MTLLTSSVLVFYSHAQTNWSLTGFQRHAQWGDSYFSLVSKFPFQIFLASYPGHCTAATPKMAANSPFQDDFSNFQAWRVCWVVSFFPSLHVKVLVKAQGWDKFRREHKQMWCSSEHIYTHLCNSQTSTMIVNEAVWRRKTEWITLWGAPSLLTEVSVLPGPSMLATPPAAV